MPEYAADVRVDIFITTSMGLPSLIRMPVAVTKIFSLDSKIDKISVKTQVGTKLYGTWENNEKYLGQLYPISQ